MNLLQAKTDQWVKVTGFHGNEKSLHQLLLLGIIDECQLCVRCRYPNDCLSLDTTNSNMTLSARLASQLDVTYCQPPEAVDTADSLPSPAIPMCAATEKSSL